MADVTILAIPGSLRRESLNRSLIALAADRAPDGIAVEVWDGLASIPAFNEDDEGDATPQVVLDLRARIAGADALLISTPEYNGSVPGALKNALDWASRPYGLAEIVGKPVALASASSSPFGAVWAQDELRKVLERSGAAPIEGGLALGRADERLALAETAAELDSLIDRLVAVVRQPVAAD